MTDERPAIDPDVDLGVPAQRTELQHTGRVVAVVAVGGVCGALVRHGLSTAWPTSSGGFPWATFVVNASGCLALGALMAWLLGRAAHPLLRPFLGTGVLGGYTTFSTYAVEADGLLRDGHGLVALAYLSGSVVVGLGAAWAGFVVGGRGHLDTPGSPALGRHATTMEGRTTKSDRGDAE